MTPLLLFDHFYMHKFKWIIRDILAGGCHPLLNDEFNLIDKQDYYTKQGIGSVVSVFEMPISGNIIKTLPWDYSFQPTNDGMPPKDLYKLCKFISKSDGTFVHCFAGTGRTATVLAAYLLFGGYADTAKEAILKLRKDYHKGSIHTPEQYYALLNLTGEKPNEDDMKSLFKTKHNYYTGKDKYEKLLEITKKEMKLVEQKFGTSSAEYSNSKDNYKKIERILNLLK